MSEVAIGDVVRLRDEDPTHLYRVWEIQRFGDGDDFVTLQATFAQDPSSAPAGRCSPMGMPNYAALADCIPVAAATPEQEEA